MQRASSSSSPDVLLQRRGRDSLRIRGLVRMTGSDGRVEAKTESTFGGTDTRKVTIKASGG